MKKKKIVVLFSQFWTNWPMAQALEKEFDVIYVSFYPVKNLDPSKQYHVVCLNEKGTYPVIQQLRSLVVRTYKLYKLCMHHQPEMVISIHDEANSNNSLLALLFQLRKLQTKTYLWVRNNPVSEYGQDWRSLVTKFFYRHLYPFATGIISQTEENIENIKQLTNHQNLLVIPNCVDVVSNQARAKESIGPEYRDVLDQYSRVFINIGRLTKQKAQHILLQAFARSETVSESVLLVVGSGEREMELKELARNLKIADRVLFVPFVANPLPLIAASDVFVQTSLWEGFPNAMSEAMSLSKPVIAINCPTGPATIAGVSYQDKTVVRANGVSLVPLLESEEEIVDLFSKQMDLNSYTSNEGRKAYSRIKVFGVKETAGFLKKL